ncbi:hypothetical protein F4777DRAFT_568203 [Nemania sp. FL0916]|nr:hypothetical protein F4777DRAFT_568203 [Nemania sp. FL0916]
MYLVFSFYLLLIARYHLELYTCYILCLVKSTMTGESMKSMNRFRQYYEVICIASNVCKRDQGEFIPVLAIIRGR